MAKELTYSKEARELILSGAEKLAKTVGVTMGPHGKNVILGKFVGAPVLTKDGVSVAREVTLENPIEDLACMLIKEAAGRTASIAGDGTTTSTVVAHEILRLGNKLINEGCSPLNLKMGIEWAVAEVTRILENNAIPVTRQEMLCDIATISANNDIEIGSKIAEAFGKVGLEGTVAAEAAPGEKTSVRFVDGIELKAGYISDAFLAGKSGSEVMLENPKILICEDEITSIASCLGLLNKLSDEGIPLVIIAKDLRQEALSTFIANNKIGRLNCVAVKIPVMGVSGVGAEKEWLSCLESLVGANLVGKNSGLPLSKLSLEDLGSAKRVSVNRFSTKILEGERDSSRVAEKLSVYQKDSQKLLGEKELLDTRNRIAFLNNKAAMITVGYSTELELKEKGDRVEDAVCATRAALEEGVLPGGGIALLRASREVDLEAAAKEIRPAAEVILKACERPFRQIVSNANADYDLIMKRVLENKEFCFGYNAASCSFEDLISGGVVDPKKVTRTALQNAASISLLLINTEAIVSEKKDDPSSWQPPSGWRPPESGTLSHKY
tara:strand:- start:5583 stop:7241 length:1659 start_codon:yes stop_codon:yes gene_type:complete